MWRKQELNHNSRASYSFFSDPKIEEESSNWRDRTVTSSTETLRTSRAELPQASRASYSLFFDPSLQEASSNWRDRNSTRDPRAFFSDLRVEKESNNWRDRSVSSSAANTESVRTAEGVNFAYFDSELKGYISSKMAHLGVDYDGKGHLFWIDKLFKEVGRGNKIPVHKISDYLPELLKCTKSMSEWSANTCAKTYSFLSKISFFSQSANLDKKARNDLLYFENELLKNITSHLKIKSLEPRDIHTCIGLLWSISDSIIANGFNQNQEVVSAFLKIVTQKMIDADFILSPVSYKEILNAVSIIITHQNGKYKSSISPDIIRKYLSEIIKIPYFPNENLNYSICLCLITKLIANSFPIDPRFITNLYHLINKINFSVDVKTAVFGLNSIFILIERDCIQLNDVVERKVREAFSVIDKTKLSLEDASSVLASLSRYVAKLNYIPENLKSLNDECVKMHIKNKDSLTFMQLSKLLTSLLNLFQVDVAIGDIFANTIDRYIQLKDEFLQFSPKDFHGFIYRLSDVLKITCELDNKFNLKKIDALVPSLLQKYYTVIEKAPSISEKINAFITLKYLIDVGQFADKKMLKVLTLLFAEIDSHLSKFSKKEFIRFLPKMAALGSLFELDKKQAKQYVELILNASCDICTNEKISTSNKMSFFWGILTFSEVFSSKLETESMDKLRSAVFNIYNNFDKKSINKNSYCQVIVLIENWLGLNATKEISFTNYSSFSQQCFIRDLQPYFPTLIFKDEYSENNLSPCDFVIFDGDENARVAIEVQGPFHYIDKNRVFKNGSTILKNALYEKHNYKIVEVMAGYGKILETDFKNSVTILKKLLAKS